MTVEVAGLRKSYGRVEAVRGIDLRVETGSLFAFLGTNGAGKSTTIGCITTLLRPDAGEIVVDGHRVGTDDDAVRRGIGVVFQRALLDPTLTVRENLQLRGTFYGLRRADVTARIAELSGLVELDDFIDRRYGTLSGGQQRRADVARALVHRPSTLFLDEPTAGLDPQSREQVWHAIGGLRANDGTTVFLTTHYMEETERADRVCIIDEGAIIATGTPTELRREHSTSVLTVAVRDRAALDRVAAAHDLEPLGDGDAVRLPVPSAEAARAIIAELGDGLLDFEFRHGRMDDVFLALTRKRAEP